MKDLKNLKSIDLSTITIIGTSINFIWSLMFVIILTIALSLVIGKFNISFVIIGIGIIFGTIILSIAEYFGVSFLYNFFIKKMKYVQIDISGMDKIIEISVLPFALIAAVISLLVSIILYPIIFLSLTFVSILYPLLQAMIFKGVSWAVFPISLIFSPLFIFYVFIIAIIFTTIGTYIFNKISLILGGLKLSLSKNGKMTEICSIDPKTAGIITGTIFLLFGLFYGLIFSILSGNFPANIILTTVFIIGGFICGFVYGTVSSVLYNFFAKKFGPVKLELECSEQ